MDSIFKKKSGKPLPARKIVHIHFFSSFPVNRRFPSCRPVPAARQQPCFPRWVTPFSPVYGRGVSARVPPSLPAPREADPTPSADDGPPRLPPFLPGFRYSRRSWPIPSGYARYRARSFFSFRVKFALLFIDPKGGKESRSPLRAESENCRKNRARSRLGCPPGRDPNRSTSIPAPPSGDCGGESGRDKGCNGEESPLPSPQTAPFPGRQRKRPYPAVPHDRPAFAQRERQTRGSSVCSPYSRTRSL